MFDSVYATLCKDRLNESMATTIMFLKRSNDQFWLPGGSILPEHASPSAAIKWWVERLTPLEEWEPNHIGTWSLSEEAGGYKVHLFQVDVAGVGFMQSRFPSSPLSKSTAWWTRWGIDMCLNRHQNMPWGQAKMAIYSLENLQATKRAKGEQLKDDLGEISCLNWVRPK